MIPKIENSTQLTPTSSDSAFAKIPDFPKLSKSAYIAECEAVWALSLSTALSPRHIDIYSKCFESYEEVLNLPPEKIRSIGLLKNKATFEGRSALLKKLDLIKKTCASLNIKIVTILDPAYPLGLRHTYLPPTVIYYRGELARYFPDKHRSYLAIVGTRRSDKFAEEITFKIAQEFTALGGHIISGLAIGIDTQAHKGACAGHYTGEGSGAPTSAVLGCGVDQIYPFGNRKLYHKILDLGGAIISEYTPGTLPSPYYFPARNRIISGLAEAVLVTQAPERSGALITVEFALEQGKNVFAYDYQEKHTRQISERNAGNHKIISEGAIPITEICDIFDHQFGVLRTKYHTQELAKDHSNISKTEKTITANPKNSANPAKLAVDLNTLCQTLSANPKTLSELSHFFERDCKEISTLLMEGILEGTIKELPGKKYYSLP